MINAKTVRCKLPDVATYERAKKGKVYPKGCTLLQVSATKGQLVYLHEDQTVDSKYCVIEPDRDRVLVPASAGVIPGFCLRCRAVQTCPRIRGGDPSVIHL